MSAHHRAQRPWPSYQCATTRADILAPTTGQIRVLLRDVDTSEIQRAYRLIDAKTTREASVFDVAGMVEAQASSGEFRLGTIRGNHGEMQVFLRYGEDISPMRMVQQTTVRAPDGSVIPLTQLAKVRLTQTKPVVNLRAPVVVTLTPVEDGGDELHKWVVEELVPALETAVPPARGYVKGL